MFSTSACYILPLDVLCFVVKAKKQILFPVSFKCDPGVDEVLLYDTFTWLATSFRKEGELDSVDVEDLTAEKHASGKCS